jgi:ATP/maltotriose-dependent transcriptional regulator MalT
LRGKSESLRILSGIFSGNLTPAGEIAAIARMLPAEDDFLHGLLHFNLGAAHVMAGETAAAMVAFERAARAMESLDTPLLTIVANVGRGEAYQMRGSLGAAERTFKQSIRTVKKSMGEHTFLHGQAILARILAVRGQCQESFNHLEQALQVAKGEFSMGDIFLVMHLARLMLLHGDVAPALYLMRLFDLEKAATEMWYHLWEPLQLLFFRAQIVAGGSAPAAAEAEAAIEGLTTLMEKAARRRRLTHRIEALVLMAYAQEQDGKPTAAA